ncbi:hypothetical protein [Rhodohalobacter sp. 614A]|uniref:hypothetical protein n=1 Tax=Rhodohalobacter sp. 614A TaxID=2908649 RepID=UPI001F2BDF41|nr:hypothetical protein [Rhodohalobacter sp. 614A]
MDNKRLFIHIGTQKTGTTTIQSILSKYNNKLLGEGICYLGRFPEIARKVRGLTRFEPELVDELRDEASRNISLPKHKNIHTYVVSNEKFSGDKMISYRNAGLIASLLKETFEPFSFDIQIIVYLRRQDSFIESTYAQRIYSGAIYSFDEFMEHFDENDFHWNDFLKQYADVFGKENIKVKRFDRKYLPRPTSLIQTFGETIGSEILQNVTEGLVENSGFSRNALEISRITNQYLSKDEMRKLRDILKEIEIKGEKCVFLTNAERKEFLKIYEKSNREVALNYLNDQTGDLFSSPNFSSENPQHLQKELTMESLSMMLSEVILKMNDTLNKERLKVKNLESHKPFKKRIKNMLRNLR